VSRAEEYRVGQEEMLSYYEPSECRILGEGDDMALTDGLMHQEGPVRQQRSHFLPDVTAEDQFSFRSICGDVAAAIQLQRSEDPPTCRQNRELLLIAERQPMFRIQSNPQDRAGDRRRRFPFRAD